MFIDDFPLFGYLNIIHAKSQSSNMFKADKTDVESQLSKKIKHVKSNSSGEYYDRYEGSGEQRLIPFNKYLEE